MRRCVAGFALGWLFGVALLLGAVMLHVPLLWPSAAAVVATFAAIGLVCAMSVAGPAGGALLGLVVTAPLAFTVIVIGMNVTPRHFLTLALGTVAGMIMSVALAAMFPSGSGGGARGLWLIVAVLLMADGAFTAARYRQPVIPIRERVDAGEYNDDNERAHLARYRWALEFCRDKTVADIASGTGYGMKILREVAKSVDGYDREKLGQQFVVDLDKDGWERHYDVIVSFETIEHLANPDFFLANVQRSAGLLLLSTPLWETPGVNRFHKQYWTFDSISALLEKRFSCRYLFQDGEAIAAHVKTNTTLIAECRPLGATSPTP